MDALFLFLIAIVAYVAGVFSSIVATKTEELIEDWKWYASKKLKVKILIFAVPSLLLTLAPVIYVINEQNLSNQPYNLSSLQLVSVSPEAGTTLSYYDLIAGIPFSAIVDYNVLGGTSAKPILNLGLLEARHTSGTDSYNETWLPVYSRSLDSFPTQTRTKLDTVIQNPPFVNNSLLLGVNLEFENESGGTDSGNSTRMQLEYPISDVPSFRLVKVSPDQGETIPYSQLITGVPFEAELQTNVDVSRVIDKGFYPVIAWMYGVTEENHGTYIDESSVIINQSSNTITVQGILSAEKFISDRIDIVISLVYMPKNQTAENARVDSTSPMTIKLQYSVST